MQHRSPIQPERKSTPHRVGLLVVLCLLAGFAAHGQDQHFSMLDLDPLLFNPAYSGFFDGAARYGLIYRNQWATVSTPFQTVSATAEWSIKRSARRRGGLGGGLWLTADRAGSIGYGTTAASGIVSYYQGLGDGDNIVSLAAEVGVGQVGFSPEALEMTDGTESFNRTRAVYPAFGVGVAWFGQVNEQLYAKFGFAMRNINEPDISHLGMSDDARLSRRLNAYLRAEWRVAESWGVLPVAGYQWQREFSEVVYGCDVRWYVDETPGRSLAFGGGILGRHKDAAMISLAVMRGDWTFGFSYDANLSRLAEASRTIGAFEIGVVYMASGGRQRTKSLPCPVF